MGLLDRIGIKYDTDKSSKEHNYLDFYEEFFAQYKNNEFILIEVGVYKGASLLMWEEYFPNAQIIGIDYRKKENIYKRARLFHADGSDVFILSDILSKNPPFIFIDDASHFYSHQITTFEESFLFVEDGGFYICEDVQTSFGPYRVKAYNDQAMDTISYFNQIAALSANDGEPGNHPLLTNITKRQKDIAKRIDYIIFKSHVILIKKK